MKSIRIYYSPLYGLGPEISSAYYNEILLDMLATTSFIMYCTMEIE